MQSESKEYVRKATGFLTNSWKINAALKSYVDEHATEVGEWMNPEVRTMLLNTCAPTPTACILKVPRDQLKDYDQLNAVEEIAGPVPVIRIEY